MLVCLCCRTMITSAMWSRIIISYSCGIHNLTCFSGYVVTDCQLHNVHARKITANLLQGFDHIVIISSYASCKADANWKQVTVPQKGERETKPHCMLDIKTDSCDNKEKLNK